MEVDICLFFILVCFDVVYWSVFKCNCQWLVDFFNLWVYVCCFYQFLGIVVMVKFDIYRCGYYFFSEVCNLYGIVLLGLNVDFLELVVVEIV